MKSLSLLIISAILFISCSTNDSDDWQLGPFVKYDANPIITPQGDTWEAKDVFNPAAFADNEQIYMLY